jgi:hypothetical protein
VYGLLYEIRIILLVFDFYLKAPNGEIKTRKPEEFYINLFRIEKEKKQNRMNALEIENQ